MKINRPLFWNNINLISILLYPLSLITFLINTIKKIPNNKNFKIKSICVGNLYAGGTGKTPLSIKISNILKKKYKTVFIKKKYSDQIETAKADFIGKELVNDEPVTANPFNIKIDTKNTDYETFLNDPSDGLSLNDKILAWSLNDETESPESIDAPLSRDGLGIAQDTTVSVGKGIVGLVESTYNMADMASKYSVGGAGTRIYRGIKEALNESQKDNPDYYEAFKRGSEQRTESLDEVLGLSKAFEVSKLLRKTN